MTSSETPVLDQRTFSYRIDKDGKMTFVNEHWDSYADDNGGVALQSERVLSKSIWQFFSDKHTILMHELIIGVAHRRKRPVTWQFRCDSPATFQVMESTVTPLANGETEYANRFTTQYSRSPLRILDHTETKSEDFITLCSWCKGVIQGKHVVTIEYINENYALRKGRGMPNLLHAMCHDCYDQQTDALDHQG
ncbi:MAG: hypothetical protein AAF438_01600 [Pseudomonadota bacterium]